MFRWVTIVVAGAGLGLAVYTAATSRQELPSPPPAEAPSVNPYPIGVAGTGLVEAASRNVQVAAPEPGLIMAVYVRVNSAVKAGDRLFSLDARPLEAEVIRAEAARAVAMAELERLSSAPRAEDIPPLRAAVDRAHAVYLDQLYELDRATEAAESGAATTSELSRKRYAMQAAEADERAAMAELDRAMAGAWDRDIAVAESKVAQADAELASLRLRIDRLTVRSPIDGRVLKRNVEPGELAPVGERSAAMVIGDVTMLNVLAQIDEEDAPLVLPGAAAMARVRGRANAMLPLRMIRIEPLGIPKHQLTGAGAELVDSRVVEMLFAIEDTRGVAIYPGLLVDVFIDTPTLGDMRRE